MNIFDFSCIPFSNFHLFILIYPIFPFIALSPLFPNFSPLSPLVCIKGFKDRVTERDVRPLCYK